MSDVAKWQVPMPSKIDGWFEIPLWVCNGGAVPYPRNKFTLKDGTVVAGGTWLEMAADGTTVVSPNTTDTEERT